MSVASENFAGAVRGPILMITIGALFLLDKFGILRFGQSWPVILIVLGALALASHNRGGAAPVPPITPDPADFPPPPPPGVRR